MRFVGTATRDAGEIHFAIYHRDSDEILAVLMAEGCVASSADLRRCAELFIDENR
jgi:hypothetical protein